ncbi:MAG: hypothetical protein Q4F17_01530 [Eubacteriales bacterium]|nr:hypothetical protein [Eubacteriales bacterium]
MKKNPRHRTLRALAATLAAIAVGAAADTLLCSRQLHVGSITAATLLLVFILRENA